MVPDSLDELLALPGVGAYTAAAVASFAFGQRHAVLDTNVRRVLARLVRGDLRPPPSPTAMEVRLAESLLPAEPGLAPRWSVAVMELGALICTADRPQCPDCPVVSECAWHRAGQPTGDPHQARRRSQGYEGTDRQCRGRLLAVLRESDGPVPAALLDAAWADDEPARPLAGQPGRGRPRRTAARRQLCPASLTCPARCPYAPGQPLARAGFPGPGQWLQRAAASSR